MKLVFVILLNMCVITLNLNGQQDSCSYMSPTFAEELSKIFGTKYSPVDDHGYKPFHLLRFFKSGSDLYFTMGYCKTFPPEVEVQDNNRVEIDTNCIYYYLINGHNVLINDYCSSTGYGLYVPCQITNKQALMEKSTSLP